MVNLVAIGFGLGLLLLPIFVALAAALFLILPLAVLLIHLFDAVVKFVSLGLQDFSFSVEFDGYAIPFAAG